MLVKCGSPADLRNQIRSCLDVGFRVNLGLRFGCFCLGSRRRRSLYFRLRLIRSVFNLRLFRLGFRRRRGFFFRLRLVGFRFGLRKSDRLEKASLVGVYMSPGLDIFFVNIPIGLFGLLMVYLHLPDYREEHRNPLDLGGLILFGSAIALLS